jgi:transposase
MGRTLYDSAFVKSAVKKYYELESFRKAADALQVSKSQLHRWVSNIGVRKKPTKRTRRNNLTDTLKQALLTMEFTAVITSYGMLASLVHEKTGISVPRSSLHRYVKQLGGRRYAMRSHETASHEIGKLDDVAKQSARNNFLETMSQFEPHEILCIDEIGFSNRTNRLHHISFHKRHVRKKIVARKHFNCIAAVSVNGFVSWQIEQRAINRVLFQRFLTKLVTRPDALSWTTMRTSKSRRCLQRTERRSYGPPRTSRFATQSNLRLRGSSTRSGTSWLEAT